MTTDCSLFMKTVSSEYMQNMLCTQIVVFVLLWHLEQFWYTTCFADVASFWKRFTCMSFWFLNLAHRIQKPIAKLRILNFKYRLEPIRLFFWQNGGHGSHQPARRPGRHQQVETHHTKLMKWATKQPSNRAIKQHSSQATKLSSTQAIMQSSKQEIKRQLAAHAGKLSRAANIYPGAAQNARVSSHKLAHTTQLTLKLPPWTDQCYNCIMES